MLAIHTSSAGHSAVDRATVDGVGERDIHPQPTEAIFDKIAMSAFVGSPLEMALRDCRLEAFAIVGAAVEVGIEPTVRHGIDLGFLPVVVTDACGAGHPEAAERSLEMMRFAGGSLETRSSTLCSALASS